MPILTSPTGLQYELLARTRIPNTESYGKFQYYDRIRFTESQEIIYVTYDKNGKIIKKSKDEPIVK